MDSSIMRRCLLAIITTSLCVTSAIAAEPGAKSLTPSENLVIDGIPPIPAELVEQIGRYTESRVAAVQDWHPTRTEMLITTRFGDVPQIHRVSKPGGARTQLTFFPDRITAATYQPKTGDYF